jgi:hypothetical protein
LANPVSKACRITHNQRKISHVPGHNCSGTHHRESSDLKSGEDSCIGANTAALFEQRFKAFPLGIPTARPEVVYKNSGRTDENIVFHYQTVPEKYAAFESDTIPQADFSFDERVIANVAVSADLCPVEHMREGPNARSRANFRTLVDQGLWVNKNCGIILLHKKSLLIS